MTSNFSEIIEASIFYIMILSIVADVVLNGTWNRMYFTSGLPLFIRRIPVGLRHTNVPLSARFEAQFHSSWTSSLAFKEIQPNTYGFREKFFEFRLIGYSPLMHGMLFFDFTNNEVVVKGFANWSIFCFSSIWLGGVILGGILNFPESTLFALAFIVFFVVLLGILYWIQYDRFTKVATFAAQEWTRKYVTNWGGA